MPFGRAVFNFLLYSAAFGLSGCATILSGSHQRIVIDTYPAQAAIWQDGTCLGSTPAEVKLRKKVKGGLVLKKEGYFDEVITTEKRLNPLLFFNLVNPIGYMIDLMCGNGKILSQSNYFRSLTKSEEEYFIRQVTSFENNSQSDIIYWNANKRLTPEDFKGQKIDSVNLHVLAGSALFISCRYIDEDEFLRVSIMPAFSAKNSFITNPGKNPDEILKHEQNHFDIGEMHARKLRKLIASTTFRKEAFVHTFNRLCMEAIQQMEKVQAAYDEDVCNALVSEEAEGKWRANIARELYQYKEYQDPELLIYFTRIGDQP